MSAEQDDAKQLAHQDDAEAEAAELAARQAAESAPSGAPQALPLSAAERAVERLLITAELIGAPLGFAEKVMAAIRAGKAEGYKRRRWFRFF
ncbi:MAG: hypothetical protein CUN49_10095 [Candidatus Thermofonsia Clade 1 bacterium]|jgi:hypothetical protein|uniref:Uncharacterized protein n=1 Tax=Candidatus Thermofonsia Clade 1 bacterium TaxID=2364210 RepID=A0A2M8PDA2_9CHLR|nr:MAG: hypothetical protein CUN49_10095 [Candidatus Thermofonsia Clade 1 bacterium]RMF50375.1 MAG: hypothetical protein D6749_10755 [Chloroflexota bacterium]